MRGTVVRTQVNNPGFEENEDLALVVLLCVHQKALS